MNNKNNENSIRKIETNGVEQIPDHERTAGPKDLFRLIFGGANTFATAVLGAFPVLFGLSFQAGVWAIVLGVLVGALILAPMGLFGPINGTNNAVSSGAHFGVHGRIVGSFLSLLTAIAFFSRSEERRVGKECRSRCDWSSDVCSSDLDQWHQQCRVVRCALWCARADCRLVSVAADGDCLLLKIGRASCRERV